MFWKKTKNSSAEDTAAFAPAPAQRTGTFRSTDEKMQWLRSRTTEDFAHTFHLMFTAIKTATQDLTLKREKALIAEALLLLSNMEKAWFAIDWKLASNSHAFSLTNIITQELPHVVHRFIATARHDRISVAFYGWDMFNTAYAPMGSKKVEADKISFREHMRTLQKHVESIHMEQMRDGFSMLSGYVPNTQTSRFPELQSEDSAIQDAVESLVDAWETAKITASAVEDQYFVEQTLISYVPEAWSLFRRFKDAPEEQQEQAQEIVLKQFTLIEQKLRSIVGDNGDEGLRVLEAQLSFLESKTQQQSTFTLK